MKKRTLFICNTVYQVLVAHWIQYHHIKAIPADIWITDHIAEGEKIAEKIKECNLFEYCDFIQSKEFINKYWSWNLKRHREIWYKSRKEIKKIVSINKKYSELYVANFDTFIQLAYNAISHSQRTAPNLIMFEDGVGTYTLQMKEYYEAFKLPFKKWEKIISSKILKCKPLYGNLKGALLFTPKDMQWNPGIIEMLAPINRDDKFFLKTINYIFGYEIKEKVYEKKYIFFEQCFDADGLIIDDLGLIEQIALKVGKERMVVKLHPRSTNNRFAKRGFMTNRNITIPWEVIAMNMDDLSEKVMITINSGSAINLLRIFNENFQIYSLQKLIMKNEESVSSAREAINKSIQKFFENYSDNIIECESVDQIV